MTYWTSVDLLGLGCGILVGMAWLWFFVDRVLDAYEKTVMFKAIEKLIEKHYESGSSDVYSLTKVLEDISKKGK